MLPRATMYLTGLLRHLRRWRWASNEGRPTHLPKGIKVIHDPKCDRQNRASARAFCFVEDGSPVIHCAANIESLPCHVIVGLLLHEVGHMIVRSRQDPEVGDDEFIVDNVPEAHYRYLARVPYIAVGGTGPSRKRIAKNIQAVSPSFVGSITGELLDG